MDELSIDKDNKKKIAGEASDLEETLTWLADNTVMTLAALSSTSLLDRHSGFGTMVVSQTALREMIARTVFKSINLNHIMRSSQNIAAATSPASVSETRTRTFPIQETISPGSSSTVPGTRPRAWVYKYTEDVDYGKLGGFVTRHLRTMDTEHIKCVVLTDWGISAKQLTAMMKRLNSSVSCYEAGIEIFDNLGNPKYKKCFVIIVSRTSGLPKNTPQAHIKLEVFDLRCMKESTLMTEWMVLF